MKKLLSSMTVLFALLALVACGGDDTSGGTTDNGGGAATTTELTINSADGATLAYVEASVEASAGEIKVTFNNKGALPHNWTLAKDADVDSLNTAAGSNAPSYNAPGALAQSKLLDGGASDTVTFTLEPGTYTYFCTFPGHLISGMKGTLVVK